MKFHTDMKLSLDRRFLLDVEFLLDVKFLLDVEFLLDVKFLLDVEFLLDVKFLDDVLNWIFQVTMQDSFILFFNNDIYLICWFKRSLEIWKQFTDAHSILSLHCHMCNFTSIVSVIDKIWFTKYIHKCIDISFCLRQKTSLNKVIQIFNLNIDNWKLSTIYLES